MPRYYRNPDVFKLKTAQEYEGFWKKISLDSELNWLKNLKAAHLKRKSVAASAAE